MKRILKSKLRMAVVVVFVLSIALSSQSLNAQILMTPKQISPINNSHFTHYPRTLTLRWSAVRGAISYDVEIDCLGCRHEGQWDSQNGPALKVASDVKTTNYSYTFVGDNRGRWRVRAARGTLKSNWSPWWYFDFKTGGSTSPGTARRFSINNIRFYPPSPASLNFNEQVKVRFDYLSSEKVYIWARPMTNGSPTPNYAAHGSPFYPKGSGEGDGYFTITSGKVTVDHVRFQMTDKTKSNVLYEKSVPVKYTFPKMLSIAPGRVVAAIPHLTMTPKQIMLDLTDAYLVFVNPSKSIQIVAQNNVLSYGGDWEKCQIYPYLYHIRQNFWKSFYWKVNTSKKEVYEVTGGTFCKLGGNEKKLDIIVDVVGGSDTIPPNRFFLRFKEAHFVYEISSKIMQLITGDKVLSYCQDFEKCNLTASVYHFKENVWQGFYWKVDTLQKKVWKVMGTFCHPDTGGTPLNIGVRIIN